MNNEGRFRIRILIALMIVVLCTVFCRLFNMQVINSEIYVEQSNKRISATMTQKAPRGEIMDRNGEILVSNREGYSVMLQKTACTNEELNNKMLKIANIFEKYSNPYLDSLPISSYPYEYTFSDDNNNGTTNDEKEKWFANKNKIKSTMTAHEVIDYYCKNLYSLSDKYTEDEKRKIIGMRYDATLSGFSISQPFKIAEDVGLDIITELKERQNEFDGIIVTKEYYRNYEQKDIAAHILGGIGKMTAEEYEIYSEKNYGYNDLIGKRGVEKLFEEYLRGVDGVQTVEMEGRSDQEVNREPVPGNYVQLTIDSDLQRTAENSLKYWITEISKNGGEPSKNKGGDACAGAAVVIDIKNGEVLACASYPTFDPSTFNADYQQLLANENKPMWNRAISGTYTPGSTFKPLVALAALEKGVVGINEMINCEGIYKYYEDYQPKCWIWSEGQKTHGEIGITEAIEFSCNYYFYELGRRLGIDYLAEYANKFGFGEKTGIEFSDEAKGNVSSREYKKKIATTEYDASWYAGDTIQTAIGQSYSYFTPIQLANYIAGIANGGTRYKTHILKSIRSSVDGSVIYEPEPEILGEVEIDAEDLNAVKQGMQGVVEEGSASGIFDDYHVKIGGKTGTAQIGKNVSDNALFVAFAPFDKPEIAVAVVIEHGAVGRNAAFVARDIFDVYFQSTQEGTENIDVGELLP